MEAYTHASKAIERLIAEQFEKATGILERCYRDYKEVKHEIDSILLSSSPGQARASHPSSKPAAPAASRVPVRRHARSTSSQHAPSPVHQLGGTQSNAGLTTPPGSSASQSSKGASASGELILLVDVYEDACEEHPVRMKTAEIKRSLIRADIAMERIQSAAPTDGDRQLITIPDSGAEVYISRSVKLTWRRPKSASTHRTLFYLVSRDALCTDILLGSEDSGERGSDTPIGFAASQQQQQGYRDVGHRQEPQSSFAMSGSFHRSQLDPLHYQAPPLHKSNLYSTESYLAHQGLQGSDVLAVQPSPPATIRNARSTRVDLSQSSLGSTETPVSNSEAPNNRLRLRLDWDETPISLWLDLDGSADAFFQALKNASKRRQVHNWESWVIWLETGPQSPDRSPYRLTLGEDLDADWGTTKVWLNRNKGKTSPHICGSIEFEEG